MEASATKENYRLANKLDHFTSILRSIFPYQIDQITNVTKVRKLIKESLERSLADFSKIDKDVLDQILSNPMKHRGHLQNLALIFNNELERVRKILRLYIYIQKSFST